MHIEALNFIQFVKDQFPDYFINKNVLDVGSGDINGNNRSLFTDCTYHGNDVTEGNNVTIVSNTKDLPFLDQSFDTVISTECFHLDPEYSESLCKIYKLLKPKGLFVFTCASTGRIEHGTKRTTPQNSFGCKGDLFDYYQNLTEKHINDVLDVNFTFSLWDFYRNSKTKDLYFVGIKYADSDLNEITDYPSNFITSKYTDDSVINTSDNIYKTDIAPKHNYMSDVCLIINTCKHYFSNIPPLLQQINQSWFPNENVIIVSGQEGGDYINYIDGVKIIYAKYTGLHLTGLIHVNENIEKYSNIRYWITLPDTIKFGDMFFDNIFKYYQRRLTNDQLLSISFVSPEFRPTMDMGIVHSNHILNMTDYLQKIKTYETNLELLKPLKKQLIYDENTILGFPNWFDGIKHYSIMPTITQRDSISHKICQIKEKLIENGKVNQVYFCLLDLYKYQRNFTSPDVELILEL